MRVYRATEKATGREYHYFQRRTYGRLEFSIPTNAGKWFQKLRDARVSAQAIGRFMYVDDPILVTYEK